MAVGVVDMIMDIFDRDNDPIFKGKEEPTQSGRYTTPVFETKYFDEASDVTADQAYDAVMSIGHQDFSSASFVRINDEFENLASTQGWKKEDIDKTKLYIQHLWETSPEDRSDALKNIKTGRIDFDMDPAFARDSYGRETQISPITEGQFASQATKGKPDITGQMRTTPTGHYGPQDDVDYARFHHPGAAEIGNITAGVSVEDPEAVDMLPGPTTYWEDTQYWNPETSRFGYTDYGSHVPALHSIQSDTVYPMVQDAGAEGVQWPDYHSQEQYIQQKYYPKADVREMPTYQPRPGTSEELTPQMFKSYVDAHGVEDGKLMLENLMYSNPGADIEGYIPTLQQAMGAPAEAGDVPPTVDANSILQQWYEDNPFRRFKAGN